MSDGKVTFSIDAEDKGFKKTVNDAANEADKAADSMEDLGDSAKETEKGFSIAEVAVANFMANALTSVIGALGNAVQSFLQLSDATREYREDMAKLETAFTTTGHSSETANNAYKDFYALLGESDRSVEAVNHLAELTKNEQEVAKWSTIAAGVTAKFGDSLPIEGLTEAANETAKVGAVTGPLADALNWAGISEEEFNKKLEACNSEQERATLITETLNKEYQAAAAEYNELTGSAQDARRATAEMEEAQADLGAAIEPVTTALTTLKAQALQAMLPIIEMVVAKLQAFQQWAEENPKKMEILKGVLLGVIVALGALAVAHSIGPAIAAVTKAFAGLNAVMALNPIGLIIAAVAGLVAAFLYLWNNCEGFREFWLNLWEQIKQIAGVAGEWLRTFFTETIPEFFSNLFSSIGGFFSSVKTSVTEFFSTIFSAISSFFSTIYNALVTFFEDPFYYIGYALGYIAGLVAKGAKEVWDFLTKTVPQILGEVVQFVSELPEKIWVWLVATVNKVITWAADMKKKAREAATNFVNNAIAILKELPGKIWTWLSETLKKAESFALELGAKGLKAAKELVSNIVEGAKELPEKMLEIGRNVVESVWQGILDAKDQFFSNVKSFFSGLVDGAKESLDINSPSKKFRWIGEMSVAGIGSGWEKDMPKVKEQISADLASLTASVKASVSAENAKVGQNMPGRDTGFYDLARAVGTQTMGINSLAGEYRRGSGSTKPVILQLNGRELGRAVLNVGGAEESRIGTHLAVGLV